MKPAEITDATFDAEVLQSTLPTLVDFWAPWCGPCRAIAPIVEELSAEYKDRMKFVKLNTDSNAERASWLGIRGIPTLLLYKEGQEVDRIVGYMSKNDLKKRLDAALAGGT